jgi:hypothetical protein
MNLLELLQLVDERLRPLAVADERALEAVLVEVAAGPQPKGVAPEVGPRAILAGRLIEIEQECRMLREHLGVQLTAAASVEAHGIKVTPVPGPSGPTDTNGPDEDGPR